MRKNRLRIIIYIKDGMPYDRKKRKIKLKDLTLDDIQKAVNKVKVEKVTR